MKPQSRPPLERRLFNILIVTGIYLAAAMLTWLVFPGDTLLPRIWPSTGIAFAALIRIGTSMWPGIALGELLASLIILTQKGLSFPTNLYAAAMLSTVSTLGALGSTYLTQRTTDAEKTFARTNTVLRFITTAALLTTMLTATLGTTGTCALGLAPWTSFGTLWLTWWFNTMVGLLIGGPFWVVWSRKRTAPLNRKETLKGILIFTILSLVLAFTYTKSESVGIHSAHHFEYLIIPIIVWATFRYEQEGATLAATITAIIATRPTSQGYGPFAMAGNENSALILLQFYLAVLAVTALLLAAILTERREAEEKANKLARFPSENPNPVLRISRENDILYANEAAKTLAAACEEEEKFSETLITTALETLNMGTSKTIEIVCKSRTYALTFAPIAASGYANIYGLDITGRKQAEADLRLNQFAMDQAPESIFMIRPDATIAYANNATCQILGYPRETLLHMTVHDVDPDFPQEAWGAHWEALKQKGTLTFESRHRAQDGREFPVEITANYLEFEDHSYNWAFARDITHRKEAQEALQQSEALFKLLIESLPQNIYSKDLDGHFIFANQNYCKLQGKPLEEIVGKTDFDLHPPELAQKYLEDDRRVIRTGKAFEIIEEHQPLGEKKFYVNVIKAPIYNIGGKITGTLGIFWDITERRRTEQAMEHLLAQVQEQAQRVQQIIDTVPEGVLLLNPKRQIILANPIAERDLRILAGIRIGERLTQLGNQPLVKLLTSPPKGLWHEIKASKRFFEVIARPIETGPTTGGWVIIIRDITREREITEQVRQQERLAAVGQLAAGIAHDFNNIMAVITLYAQMLSQLPDFSPKTYDRLDIIHRQAQQATKLIQQILDFSRRSVLERHPIDLRPFLKETVKLLTRTLPENINVALACGTDEYTIDADPTRIQQMLMNLAVNARDAMPDGGRFKITMDRLPDSVRINISDNGSGIPEEALPHIFEPFFTTKEPGQGTGLGLAQVYGIVKQHQGDIKVKSKLGHGTTFTIHLPALSCPAEAVLENDTPLTKGHGETILVVEDNIATRNALTDSLEMLGYQVLTAANGQEALVTIAEHGTIDKKADGIALVLSDVVMPDMGGIALLHALQQQNLAIKVLLLTGHPLKQELENLKKEGLAGWLSKPPDLGVLAEAIASALHPQ